MKSLYVTSRIPLCRAAKEQFPKAAAFGAFSWFVLCRAAKNEHQNRHSAARSSMRVCRGSCLKFSKTLPRSPSLWKKLPLSIGILPINQEKTLQK
jgi:hypothetical protein